MKRSKIFLGISTAVLAIVAFTTAKTARFTILKPSWYSTGNGCTLRAPISWYTSGTVQCTNGQQQGIFLYTHNDGAICAHPLFTRRSNDD